MNFDREEFLLNALKTGKVSVHVNGRTILGAQGTPIGYSRPYGWSVQVTGPNRTQRSYPASNVVWYAHGNRIPHGKLLTFKDGDRHNHHISNLELATRAEISYRFHEIKRRRNS